MSKHQSMSVTIFVAVILLWGANWPIIKFGLMYMPPLYFAVCRLMIGSATLFSILMATGNLRIPQRTDVKILLSESLLHMAAPIAFMNIALQYVPAGRSAVLSFTTPLWIAPANFIIFGERPNLQQSAGLIVGIIGLIVLFNPVELSLASRQVWVGNGLLMLAALTWAIAIVIARNYKGSATSLQLSPWQMLIAATIIVPEAVAFETWNGVRWSWQLTWVMAFNGPVATGFCFWGAFVVARDFSTLTTSMGFMAVPVAGILFSAFALGEVLTPALITGLVLIIAGIAAVNFRIRVKGNRAVVS